MNLRRLLSVVVPCLKSKNTGHVKLSAVTPSPPLPHHVKNQQNKRIRYQHENIYTVTTKQSKSAGGAFLYIMTRPLLAPSRSCFFCFLPTACWFLLSALMRNGIKVTDSAKPVQQFAMLSVAWTGRTESGRGAVCIFADASRRRRATCWRPRFPWPLQTPSVYLGDFLFFLKETKIAESDRCLGEMQILDGGCVPVWGL